MGISIGDTLAATDGCMGALAALHARERTGKGQIVDSALYEAVLQVMESLVPEYEVSGYIRERSGSALPGIAPSNVYRCADGDYLIGANQDAVFARLCTDIFYSNSVNCGLLPATVDPAGVAALLRLAADRPREGTVDLHACTITLGHPVAIPFQIADLPRRRLLEGRDAIADTLQQEPDIIAYERRHAGEVMPSP